MAPRAKDQLFVGGIRGSFLAMLLEPAVKFLIKFKFSRSFASFLVVCGFLLASVAIVWLSYLYLAGMAADIPEFILRSKQLLSEFMRFSQKFEPATHSLRSDVATGIQAVRVVEPMPMWSRYLLRGMGPLYEILSLGIFVPLILFFLLSDKENLVENFNGVMGKYFYLPILNSQLPRMIRKFFAANLFTGVVLIGLQGIMLFALGFKAWMPVAVFSGLLNLVPVIGAPLAMLFCAAQGLVQFDSAFPFVMMSISILAFHLLANDLVLPKLLGAQINVNSVALMFGMLFWSWLWGAMGFLLAIPMTALVKIMLESSSDTAALARLLATRPARPRRSMTALRGLPEVNN